MSEANHLNTEEVDNKREMLLRRRSVSRSPTRFPDQFLLGKLSSPVKTPNKSESLIELPKSNNTSRWSMRKQKSKSCKDERTSWRNKRSSNVSIFDFGGDSQL